NNRFLIQRFDGRHVQDRHAGYYSARSFSAASSAVWFSAVTTRRPGFDRLFNNRFLIQRFDGRHVQDRHAGYYSARSFSAASSA
ncbi:hypothetical protein CQA67_32840, partial [Klebsiella pneumoniae]